jgi:hypothetical protein
MFKSTKIETSIQRSDSAKSDSDNPSSLQDTVSIVQVVSEKKHFETFSP